MAWQSLIVALLVIGCTASAAWSLLPAAARRGVAVFVLRLPVSLPRRMAGFFRRHAEASNACGCDGCDRSELKSEPKVATPATAVVRFHRRMPKGPASD